MWFYVAYQVQGFGRRTAGPFKTREQANTEAADIGGYEGVSDVRIVDSKGDPVVEKAIQAGLVGGGS